MQQSSSKRLELYRECERDVGASADERSFVECRLTCDGTSFQTNVSLCSLSFLDHVEVIPKVFLLQSFRMHLFTFAAYARTFFLPSSNPNLVIPWRHLQVVHSATVLIYQGRLIEWCLLSPVVSRVLWQMCCGLHSQAVAQMANVHEGYQH